MPLYINCMQQKESSDKEITMRKFNILPSIVLAALLGMTASALSKPGDSSGVQGADILRTLPEDPLERSAAIAGYSLSKVQRWLHTVALPKIDPETKLWARATVPFSTC